MKIKKYLKNLWNELKYDESGQLDWPLWKAIGEARKKAQEPKRTPSYAQSLLPVYGYTPTKAPTTYKTSPQVAPYAGYRTPTAVAQKPIGGTPGTTAATPATTGGVGGVPMVSGFPTYQAPQFPTYTPPAISLNIPSFAWSPTEAQRAGWGETAKTRAGLVIDPQRQAEMEALESYKSEVTGQMGEINPRMTKMSLALANMVENTMKQDIIDELIRRGATTSGELPRQLGEAGRYEVEQRRGVEEERNRLIGELQRGQLGREELSGERLTELERMRGMQEASELFEQERYERGAVTAEKSALFEAQLAQASLQNQIAAAQYESAYKQRLFEAEMGQQTWERGFSEQQLALQRATAAYAQQPEPEVEKTDIEQMIEELTRRQLEGMLGSSAYTKPTGPYSHAGLPGFY